MAVSTGGNMPLYMHIIQRILRDLRIAQQKSGKDFSYADFKQRIECEAFTEAQRAPLKQRLDTLESFMVAPGSPTGTSWEPKRSQLTIVDLSCPCITPEMACSLFNICLSLFLEQKAKIGRIVALDEAHKYMRNSPECLTLTQRLLEVIRLQRHLAARVIISTQEPTISPKLLDLCSVSVVHRFTSPDWLHALRKHLAGISITAELLGKANLGVDAETDRLSATDLSPKAIAGPSLALFSNIVKLRVGEALLLAPNAIIGVKKGSGEDTAPIGDVKRLGHGVLKVRIRNRVTEDGGKSIMAA